MRKANPAAAVRGFLDALNAQYVGGVDGAIGKWKDSGASTEGIDVDRLEGRVREATNAANEKWPSQVSRPAAAQRRIIVFDAIEKVRGELLGAAVVPSVAELNALADQQENNALADQPPLAVRMSLTHRDRNMGLEPRELGLTRPVIEHLKFSTYLGGLHLTSTKNDSFEC